MCAMGSRIYFIVDRLDVAFFLACSNLCYLPASNDVLALLRLPIVLTEPRKVQLLIGALFSATGCVVSIACLSTALLDFASCLAHEMHCLFM